MHRHGAGDDLFLGEPPICSEGAVGMPLDAAGERRRVLAVWGHVNGRHRPLRAAALQLLGEAKASRGGLVARLPQEGCDASACGAAISVTAPVQRGLLDAAWRARLATPSDLQLVLRLLAPDDKLCALTAFAVDFASQAPDFLTKRLDLNLRSSRCRCSSGRQRRAIRAARRRRNASDGGRRFARSTAPATAPCPGAATERRSTANGSGRAPAPPALLCARRRQRLWQRCWAPKAATR
mmetsp:Transcript_68599/g.199054  ORF Transcript_68599/g.199054 Transcript_68599/m.199054 type:complete len:238 (+) Transcript_68599:1149-1862(+)